MAKFLPPAERIVNWAEKRKIPNCPQTFWKEEKNTFLLLRILNLPTLLPPISPIS